MVALLLHLDVQEVAILLEVLFVNPRLNLRSNLIPLRINHGLNFLQMSFQPHIHFFHLFRCLFKVTGSLRVENLDRSGDNTEILLDLAPF